MRIIAAYTALKRSNMMRDMQAMVNDYLQEGMTAGSQAYTDKAAQLANDVTSIHDMLLDTGIIKGILTFADAELHNCIAADSQWLLNQLQHDITKHKYNV